MGNISQCAEGMGNNNPQSETHAKHFAFVWGVLVCFLTLLSTLIDRLMTGADIHKLF